MAEAAPATQVTELVVNLDDVTGELLGHVTTCLLEAGALDVWTTPIVMKKQRPGHQLSVLCAPELAAALTHQLLKESGSFGVRRREWDRCVLDRELLDLPTDHGPLRIKVGSLDGRIVQVKPEHEALVQWAYAAGLTLHQAQQQAAAVIAAWRAKSAGGGAA